MTVFTDALPFLETGKVGASLPRLNQRYEIFMRPNEQEFVGARVLDLGSHDGRWTYAALQAGAKHVTGVEWDQSLVNVANESLSELFPGEYRFEFVPSDITSYLASANDSFDIVLCLGLLYHINDAQRALKLIRDLEPKLLVLDTSVVEIENIDNLLDSVSIAPMLRRMVSAPKAETTISLTWKRNSGTWETIPSRQTVEFWLGEAGFEYSIAPLPPAEFIDDRNTGINDYYRHQRYSFVCRPSQ